MACNAERRNSALVPGGRSEGEARRRQRRMKAIGYAKKSAESKRKPAQHQPEENEAKKTKA